MIRRFQPVLLGLFFVTGFTGLIYELLWVRMFTLVFGATVLAVSTVLTAFFAGLALGSFAFGRIVDRFGKPLLLYGLLELGIAVYAVFVPALIAHAQGVDAVLMQHGPASFYLSSLVRFLVSFLLIVVPTTLMGASLPVLSRFMIDARERIGKDLGYLYAVNTVGASLGCLVTGFVLIESLGVGRTHTLAIVLNLLIGILALALHWMSRSVATPTQRSVPPPDLIASARGKRRARRPGRSTRPTPVAPAGQNSIPEYSPRLIVLVLTAFGISGAAALAYEVLWTRNLGVTLHSTTYSFTLILTTFLCGLGLGSFLYGKFLQRSTGSVFWFGAIQVAIGLYALGLIHFFRVMPGLASDLIEPLEGDWATMITLQLLLCFAVMLIPTLLLGSTFPLASRICASRLERLGKTVGGVYAVNCVGGIVGSFLAGFVIIPTIGVKQGMMVVAAANVVAGLVLLGCAPAVRARTKKYAMVTTAIVAVAGLLAGHTTDLYVGIGTSADERRLRYYKDGLVSNVRVEQTVDNVLLMIDDKVQAGRLGARSSQGLGHIPMLLHPNPRDVLTIGMGAGMTAGAVARHPVESIQIVDLVASLAQTAPFFSNQNHDILGDARTRFVIGDGRNYLLTTDERFDVIVADIFFPAGAGTGSLYSLGHYRLARTRLREGGMLVQWVPLYQLTEREFRIIAATFLEVFPHVELWLGDPDMMYPVVGLIGREGAYKIDVASLRQRLARQEVSRELVFGDDALSLLCTFLVTEKELARYVADAPLNTDDRPRIEFSTPRNNYTKRRLGWETIQKLTRLKTSVVPLLDVEALGVEREDTIRQIARSEAGRRHYYRGTFALGNGQAEVGFQAYREARALAPKDAFIDFHTSESIGRLQATLGNTERAVVLLEAAVRLRPDETNPRLLLAQLYAEADRWDRVESHLTQVVRYQPEHALALGQLGELYARQERWEETVHVLARALDILPVANPQLERLQEQALEHMRSQP